MDRCVAVVRHSSVGIFSLRLGAEGASCRAQRPLRKWEEQGVRSVIDMDPMTKTSPFPVEFAANVKQVLGRPLFKEVTHLGPHRAFVSSAT